MHSSRYLIHAAGHGHTDCANGFLDAGVGVTCYLYTYVYVYMCVYIYICNQS